MVDCVTPVFIGSKKGLFLDLENCKECLWCSFDNLVALCSRKILRLKVSNNQLNEFYDSLLELKNLLWLEAANNCLKEFPRSTLNLSHIRKLNLERNLICEIPENLSLNLSSLKELKLGYNMIKRLPSSFSSWSSLEYLYLEHNQMQELTCAPKNIIVMDCSYNMIDKVKLHRLKRLETLNLCNNSIQNCHLCKLKNIKFINLSNNKIDWIDQDTFFCLLGTLNLLSGNPFSRSSLTCSNVVFHSLRELCFRKVASINKSLLPNHSHSRCYFCKAIYSSESTEGFIETNDLGHLVPVKVEFCQSKCKYSCLLPTI